MSQQIFPIITGHKIDIYIKSGKCKHPVSSSVLDWIITLRKCLEQSQHSTANKEISENNLTKHFENKLKVPVGKSRADIVTTVGKANLRRPMLCST